MKFLDCPTLANLSEALNHEGPECSVHTRIEAYSCKQIKRDKKLFKSLEQSYQTDVSNSPPLPSWTGLDREAEMTPFGPIGKESSRKTLYLLISTLNNAFPDYDFSNIQPSQFNKEESGASVLNALSTTLVAPHRAGMTAPRTYSSYPPSSSDAFPSSEPTSSSPLSSILRSPFAPPPIVSGTHPTLFRLIDEVIGLKECEVFSYAPEIESDPHASDFSDDEVDISPDDEEGSSSDEELFQFDDYDVDEIKPPNRARSRYSVATPRVAALSSGFTPSYKRRGTLLWSSHWFFLNRKLKRILFVSIWARSRGLNRSWTSDEEFDALHSKTQKERFLGWEGGAGAGARALGL
ncbi:Repressor of RNA polymerase III transcription MAF1 [Mycena indigotica]|uniref:Repressor of RNA polymerase III transcription MAF1 n=1 Tax=Mycena indigotica TaxID=2126181 RepID=A0A8H6T516_9AGAR|nr:Repressor of RNA polymerase III transcription MAF1 [Mycena indigotica]KAF7312215.1 Repressor of RNA polymerase III transcription MAF1 [Mycena indigotica]